MKLKIDICILYSKNSKHKVVYDFKEIRNQISQKHRRRTTSKSHISHSHNSKLTSLAYILYLIDYRKAYNQ